MGKKKDKRCGDCSHFDLEENREKESCPYEGIGKKDEICKKFFDKNDYKVLKEKTVTLSKKQEVRITAYTWKNGDPKIKLLTLNTGQKGKTYAKKDHWPKCTPKEAAKLCKAIAKLVSSL